MKGAIMWRRHFGLRVLSLLASFTCISPGSVSYGQTVLVNFGSDAAGNSFGLPGWNNLLLSADMGYTTAGPGGVIVTSDPGVYADFMGVTGTARRFSKGERIVATWYNTSDDVISFTSRVSFRDNNGPSEGSPDGNWYTMRSFSDYRYAYQSVQPHDSAKTAFNIADAGVHKTDSVYSLVNINLCIEWFDNEMKRYIICDRIELMEDADTVPPCIPSALSAPSVSSFQVSLEWLYPCRNTDVVEYVIYSDDEVEGYSRETSFTAYNLNQSTEYRFSVAAVDRDGNESLHSDALTVTTPAFKHTGSRLNPSGLEYMGAVALPEGFAYGADGMTYNRNGDGGQSGSGSSDGYPGSLFVTDINQPDRGFVGEVSIPVPVKSPTRDMGELPTAATLKSPVNIRPENVNSWDYVDVWITGLEYVPGEHRLYSSWAIYYDVTSDKTASLSCLDADSLDNGVRYGAWILGSSNASEIPRDSYLNDYLFRVPQGWADAATSGRSLVCGRYREGGLSGLGPTLYATSLVGGGTPPPPNSERSITPLLQYGPVEETDNYNFPYSMNDYNHADWLKGAEWVSAGDQSAVAIIGNKGLGHNYYGYTGERMRHDWVVVDEPYPEFASTDPNGKGWKAYNSVPVIMLYDPDDLAVVARRTMETYRPQPYAALRLDRQLFFGSSAQISSTAYDADNSLLYVAEFVPENFGNIVVHVWKVNYVPAAVSDSKQSPGAFTIEQNYPNPFNPATVLRFHIPKRSEVRIEIVNVLGQSVKGWNLGVLGPGIYSRVLDLTGHASGVYFCRISAEARNGLKWSSVRKLVLLR